MSPLDADSTFSASFQASFERKEPGKRSKRTKKPKPVEKVAEDDDGDWRATKPRPRKRGRLIKASDVTTRFSSSSSAAALEQTHATDADTTERAQEQEQEQAAEPEDEEIDNGNDVNENGNEDEMEVEARPVRRGRRVDESSEAAEGEAICVTILL